MHPVENIRLGAAQHARTNVFRLTPDAYEALVRQLPRPYIGRETTALEAAQFVGIEHVLRKLREGFVVGA